MIIVEEMRPETLIKPLAIAPDLRLSPLAVQDAPALFRLVDEDRDRLGARLPWVEFTTSESASLAFIKGSIARRDVTNGGDGSGDWAIIARLPAGERMVGVIGLHPFQWKNRHLEIGYWINGEHEGRGWITRSAEAVLAHLFRAGFHRVEIRAAADNRRSRSVAERLKFTLEGELRSVEWLHGRPIDHAVYGRLRTD